MNCTDMSQQPFLLLPDRVNLQVRQQMNAAVATMLRFYPVFQSFLVQISLQLQKLPMNRVLLKAVHHKEHPT